MLDHTATIENFLDATASKTPTPGGGSVAALAGALSAAIGQMVISYSIGKKDLLQFERELKQVGHELEMARKMLLQLMVDDQQAYAELTLARKLPAEETDRQSRIAAAISACIQLPQTIAATAIAVLGVCDRAVDMVNPWLLSDLAVCADLAMATVRGALYSVRVNLNSLENQSQRTRFADDSEKMLAHATNLVRKVSPAIWSRYQQVSGK